MRAHLLLTAATLLGMPYAATAQSNRVFASARSGNDSNNCSNVNSPCQTLQRAVDQVAGGGSVLVLDSGGYGPVYIYKSVTIEAPSGIEAFIHPPSGDAVRIDGLGAGDVVVLRGLTLSVGPSNGILFASWGALHVERCVIQGFPTGIRVTAGSGVAADLYVEDTVVRNCTDGIQMVALGGTTGAIRASIERSQLVGSAHYGLDCENGCTAVVRGSLAAGNGTGMNLSVAYPDTTGQLMVERCAIANNQTGAQSATNGTSGASATLRLSNSTVTGTAPGLGAALRQVGAAQLLSRLNNTVEGNGADAYGTIGTYSPR